MLVGSTGALVGDGAGVAVQVSDACGDTLAVMLAVRRVKVQTIHFVYLLVFITLRYQVSTLKVL